MSRRPEFEISPGMVAALGSAAIIVSVVLAAMAFAPAGSDLPQTPVTATLPPVDSVAKVSVPAPVTTGVPTTPASTPATTPPPTPAEPPTEQPKANRATTTDQAQSNAQNAVAQAVACYADTQSFSKCNRAEELGNTGLAIVSGTPGAGEVQFSGQGTRYAVSAGAIDGLLFSITGDFSGGAATKTCQATGSVPCPSPTW